MSLVAPQSESLRRSPVWLYFPPSGDVAQLGERRGRNGNVEVSIPLVSPIEFKRLQLLLWQRCRCVLQVLCNPFVMRDNSHERETEMATVSKRRGLTSRLFRP